MKPLSRLPIVVAWAILILSAAVALWAQKPPERQVAITIDDLPAGSANTMPTATISEMTAKLLGTLRDQKIPAVGFVNERKLYKFGEVDERIKLSTCGSTTDLSSAITLSATCR